MLLDHIPSGKDAIIESGRSLTAHTCGYTHRMWRYSLSLVFAALVLGCSGIIEGAETTLTTPDGRPIVWADWVSDHSPVAVLLWASWVPDAERTLADLDAIVAATGRRGLDFVVVAVQEPLDEASKSLAGTEVSWLHDRYGRLLKDYRVVAIPRLLVFADDGRLIERLEIDQDSMRHWGSE